MIHIPIFQDPRGHEGDSDHSSGRGRHGRGRWGLPGDAWRVPAGRGGHPGGGHRPLAQDRR